MAVIPEKKDIAVVVLVTCNRSHKSQVSQTLLMGEVDVQWHQHWKLSSINSNSVFMGEKSFPHKISHPPDGDGVMGVQHVIDAECLIVVEWTSIMMTAERKM